MCDSWVIVNNNRPGYLNAFDRGTRKGRNRDKLPRNKIEKSDVTQNFNFVKN